MRFGFKKILKIVIAVFLFNKFVGQMGLRVLDLLTIQNPMKVMMMRGITQTDHLI